MLTCFNEKYIIFSPKSLDSQFCFCIQSVSVEVCLEILASHTYVVGKGRSTLIAFIENYGYSSDTTAKLNNSYKWLVATWIQITSVNFSPSVTLKSIDLAL